MQAWRNAFQKQLSKEVSVAGVTLARFLWASPLAAMYLAGLYQWQPVALPTFNHRFVFFIVGAAVAQIIATALMVKLFKLRNYAIGAGLAKSEAILAAILGVAFFSESLSFSVESFIPINKTFLALSEILISFLLLFNLSIVDFTL